MRRLLHLPFLVMVMGVGAAAMLIPAAHALVMGEHAVSRAFFYSAVLLLIVVGMLSIALVNHRPRDMARSQLAGILGAYLLMPVLFALPFRVAVPDTTWLNVWFEMLSCFTTTGATVYDMPGRLLPSLHLWRAMVGWMGGFFVLLTAVAIMEPLNLGGIEVMTGRPPGRPTFSAWIETAETSERIVFHAMRLFPIYGGLTVLLWALLLIAGQPGLYALSYAMGTISTSGIAPGPGMMHAPRPDIAEILVFAFLAFAVTRRFMFGSVPSDRSRPVHEDPELRLAGLILLLAPTLLILRHWLGNVDYVQEGPMQFLYALWGSLFTMLSMLTTTGYVSAGWDVARGWSGLDSSGVILMGLAVVGGGVGTAAGGVTLLRVHALISHSRREMERIIHPSSVGGGGLVARRIRGDGAYVAWIFLMLFLISISVVLLALTLAGVSFERALILSVASLTTTGPLSVVAGEVPVDWRSLGAAAKVVLGVAMILGRIETLAILALISPATWRR
ncbi:TrkH family potassium uptake protein [Falsirhodobacter algicola]|uniref:TrkH family potassium uptake protein n=1 Tax=Falsirhodobacter algicola TaxID=2692330 RepID=A0A8J8MRT6_9RHOB|nr:TrkH family potassium uptake protein [Falsirhodobacter algicola]QUS35254.1 TrkH family potassium uptake protein [Falsirhodobacter algicola]